MRGSSTSGYNVVQGEQKFAFPGPKKSNSLAKIVRCTHQEAGPTTKIRMLSKTTQKVEDGHLGAARGSRGSDGASAVLNKIRYGVGGSSYSAFLRGGAGRRLARAKSKWVWPPPYRLREVGFDGAKPTRHTDPTLSPQLKRG